MHSLNYLLLRNAGYAPSGRNILPPEPTTPGLKKNNGSSIQKKSSEEDNGVSAGNPVRHALDGLGGNQSPAAHEHDDKSATPTPIAKSASDNNKSNDSVSDFFKNISIKYAWAGAYTGSNILRIGENILDEVGKSDAELAAVVAVINIVRMAVVVILQIYDTASAEHSGNELVKKESDSKDLLEKLKEGGDAIQLAQRAKVEPASTLFPAEKEDSVTPCKNDDSAEPDQKPSKIKKPIEDYCIFSKAKNNVEAHSPSVGEAKTISGLVSAKETFFTAGAVLGLVKGVVTLVKITLPAIIAGTTTATGIVVASLVLAVVSAVAGMAANLIDIYQGFAKRKEAREEIKYFSNRKSAFEEKTKEDKLLGEMNSLFKSGFSSFFDKKIASANTDENYAVFRIIRGFVGLCISVANTVCLIVSGGSTSPIAGIVGGVTLAVYFGFIIHKIKMEVLKVAAEIEECNAAEDWKEKYADTEIFDQPADSKSGTENDNEENPYCNQYFLAWMVAKQFKKDVIGSKEVPQDMDKVRRMDDLLQTIGFIEEEIEVLRLLRLSPAEAPKAMELIEEMIRSKLKITDRKPQQKEPAQVPKTKIEETGAAIPGVFQTV